jgi:hypothetical protein
MSAASSKLAACKSIAVHELIAVVVMTSFSLWTFGSLFGLLVPLFGIALPVLVALSPGHPIASQMLVPSLGCLGLSIIVMLGCWGKVHVVAGHVALFLLNGLALLCLLALS